jgi:cytochrome bd ubiquinol oxidase subunit I
VIAYGALQQLRHHPDDAAARTAFNAHVSDLGYGLLLKRYTANVTDATPAEINKAAWDTVPNVPALFWTFRLMVGFGFFFIAFFAFAFWLSAKRRLDRYSWFLRLAVIILPLPWIAAELGWFVAENGRQPWTIDGILPTFLSASSLTADNLWLSLGGFVVFYSVLAVVELYLMVKYIKLGPEAEFSPPAAPAAPALSLAEGGR